MSCSNAARPGTLVRERIQPIVKPKITANTVAIAATSKVLPKMCA